MATCGLFTIGVKCPPPMPPWFEMVKVPPFSSSSRHLALARFPGQVLQLPRQLEQVLLIRVADDRHDQARFRIHRNADVVILLEDNLLRRPRRGWH